MSLLQFIAKPYISDVTHIPGDIVPVHGFYYLCVSAGGKFPIEIIKGAELVKPLYKEKYYRVIGIAAERSGAFELVRRVVEEFVASGDGFDVFADYIRSYEGE